MPPDLCVVIPHRNHSRYLESILRQLSEQTLPPSEVIVVDDHSETEHWEACRRAVASLPTGRMMRLENWSGPNVAITTGLRAARHEIVAITAADDWLSPEFLERSYDAIQRHAAALVFSDPAEFREDPKDAVRFGLCLSSGPRFFSADGLELRLRRASFTFSTNTILWRRKQLIALGGFRPDLAWHADWLAAHAMALTYGAAYIPENLTALRLRADSYSAQSLRRREGRGEVFARTLRTLVDSAPEAARRLGSAGVLPEYDVRYIPLLFRDPRARPFLSTRAFARCVGRHAWAGIRPYTPAGLRKWLRGVVTSTVSG
jgi:glycosyltransferase involved in cell wall biosynthesis